MLLLLNIVDICNLAELVAQRREPQDGNQDTNQLRHLILVLHSFVMILLVLYQLRYQGLRYLLLLFVHLGMGLVKLLAQVENFPVLLVLVVLLVLEIRLDDQSLVSQVAVLLAQALELLLQAPPLVLLQDLFLFFDLLIGLLLSSLLLLLILLLHLFLFEVF